MAPKFSIRMLRQKVAQKMKKVLTCCNPGRHLIAIPVLGELKLGHLMKGLQKVLGEVDHGVELIDPHLESFETFKIIY